MLSAKSAPLAATPSGRLSYARIAEVRDGVSVDKFEVPNLIELQLESFQWFIEKGLRDLFDEISPIKDFTGKVMELQFLDYEFGTPKYSEEECRTKDLTFSRPLYVNVELLIKETGEIQRQRVYMGDYPWMTDMGTFVINGAERVVVSQLVRSPGVYYSELEDPASGRMLFSAKVIPNRGAWLEFETNNKDQLWVKVDRKRKIAATTLLRAVGYETNDEIAGLFGAVDTDPEHPFIANTLDKDLTKTPNEALIEVYKKLRPGDPPTGDNARQLVESLFFNFRRYDLGRVGRYKFNKKLDGVAARMGIELPREGRTITREDIAAIVGHLIECNRGLHPKDDIDHLGNRRIRANGELIQNAFRIGLLRMERVVRERMTIQEIDKATPERPHQHPPGRGGDEGVLRRQPAEPVHGPDEPAGRAHLEAPPERPGPGRPVARARRVRRPRRPPQPLRPDLPDRDARGPEHRPDRLARDLRPDQRLRLHRDALPQGQADRRPRRPAAARRTRPAPTSSARTARSSSRRASRSPRPPTRSSPARRRSRSRSARSSPTTSTTSRPTRRRSITSRRRTRRSTPRTTSSASACRAATGTRSPRRARTRSSTWTSAPSRSSRWRRR